MQHPEQNPASGPGPDASPATSGPHLDPGHMINDGCSVGALFQDMDAEVDAYVAGFFAEVVS